MPNGSRVRKERLVAAAGLLALALIFSALVALLDGLVRSWTDRDLERRASLVWRALEPDIERTDETTLLQRLDSLASDDRVVGILVCYGRGARELANGTLPETIGCRSALVRGAIAADGSPIAGRVGKTLVQLTAHRFGQYRENAVVVVHDRGFVSGRRRGLLRMLLFGGGALLLLTWMTLRYGTHTARQNISSSIRELVQQIGRGERPHTVPDDLQPIAEDLGATVKKLRQQRPVIDETAGPERLRHYVEQHMPNTSLVLVANREPYVHEKDGEDIRVKQPPSGLVTGVEPLLRACGGTWVAHGAGSADRETSDPRGRVAVPPDAPEYVLRRVWLTEREEEGYYYGFSNEGLWPLCHIAHTRPTFRADDWQDYVTVNRRFAATAVEESGDHGLILAQDYHFALVPRFVRELAPSTVISLFWHIPWPNPEVVGICPWRRELLDGMLGADVIGFHTRYHCLNFLETLQRSVECRVDHSTMSVEYQGRRTMVKEYPISITWPYPAAPRAAGRVLRRQFGIADSTHVTIGVDRADYTKGLLERVAAVERLLETNPALVGKFVLVQLAAPSRTHIKKYRDLINDLEDAVIRVNRRFSRGSYKPIILELKSFSPEEVRAHYALADSALVTPLHDGMNLVAKEYAASCADGHGVLVLSTFAGAARELEGALIVNPYDAEDVAAALARAIEMPEREQAARIESMQAAIARNTIYDWAEKLLRDMAEIWERQNTSWNADSSSPRVPALSNGR